MAFVCVNHFSLWRICNPRYKSSVLLKRHLSQVSSVPVRVRFAPSPTGFIHLGGLRTAFFNYLFAKQHNGKFILRIEDTDQERVVPGSLEHIIETLKWSKMVPDEGPTFGGDYGSYIQSERKQLYSEMLDKLTKTKSVYRCFCSTDRLDLLRREASKNGERIRYDNRCRFLTNEEINMNMKNEKPFTVRLRLKEGPVTVNDLVYGEVTYDLSRIEGDPIIVKSDGMPTYHFANVVDDHFMQISHVFRGVEWLVSTPKHLMLYDAFGWSAPRFAHLPLIVNREGNKLSKRHDHIQINFYRKNGYFPETIYNYLTNLGGGFGSLETAKADKIYPLSSLCDAFNLQSVNKNDARIDTDKFKLLNRLAIKEFCQTDIDRIVVELQKVLKQSPQLSNVELSSFKVGYLKRVIEWSLDRIYTLNELIGEEFIFLWTVPKFTWQPSSFGINETVSASLTATINNLRELTDEDFNDKEMLLARVKDLHRDKLDTIKYGPFMRLLRFSLTNLKAGSPIAETLQLLGKNKSINHLESALNYVTLYKNTTN